MKILLLADHESHSLYEYYSPEKLADVELIIACGDLKPSYLEFFATMSKAPVLYVLGNHDHWHLHKEAEGCICLEDTIYEYNGIRILGLGGSMRYLPNTPCQYSEKEMKKRIQKLHWKLFCKKGFDILVTHAPAQDFHDLSDLPHQGFRCFHSLIERYKPKFFVHGHVHPNYSRDFVREDKLGETIVINGYEHYFFEYPNENLSSYRL